MEDRITRLPVADLKLNPKNPRTLSEEKVAKLQNSLRSFPEMLEARPLVVDENNVVLGGNARLLAAQALGLETLPVYRATWSAEKHDEFIIKDNVSFGEWDWDILANEWNEAELLEWGLEVWQPDAFDRFEPQERPALKDVFGIPPTTILNSRAGEWQERKKAWKAMIQENGESREGTLAKGEMSPFKPGLSTNGVSILDPVLAEAMVHWFGVQGGHAIDPFAGDTVFGYVAASTGMEFTGIELRQEQADVNNERTKDLKARYICDTGENVLKHIGEARADLLFSCPPYYDLEVYSDDPRDASNQASYQEYLDLMTTALTAAAKCLKPNRFAVIVIGDVRDKKGSYHRIPDHICEIMEAAGMRLLNELILVEPIGQSGAMRARNSMKHRKVFKCHQNVLVFYNGEPSQIKNHFEEIDLSEVVYETDETEEDD